MAAQCCNCPNPVTNETAQGFAPACDECRERWRNQAVADAIRVLMTQGYTVITPGGQAIKLLKFQS